MGSTLSHYRVEQDIQNVVGWNNRVGSVVSDNQRPSGEAGCIEIHPTVFRGARTMVDV